MSTVFVNCTPHPIKLNDGTVYPKIDNVARVSSQFTDFVDGICKVVYGDTTGVPAPKANTKYRLWCWRLLTELTLQQLVIKIVSE